VSEDDEEGVDVDEDDEEEEEFESPELALDAGLLGSDAEPPASPDFRA
jgi:hypothetical protein